MCIYGKVYQQHIFLLMYSIYIAWRNTVITVPLDAFESRAGCVTGSGLRFNDCWGKANIALVSCATVCSPILKGISEGAAESPKAAFGGGRIIVDLNENCEGAESGADGPGRWSVKWRLLLWASVILMTLWKTSLSYYWFLWGETRERHDCKSCKWRKLWQ